MPLVVVGPSASPCSSRWLASTRGFCAARRELNLRPPPMAGPAAPRYGLGESSDYHGRSFQTLVVVARACVGSVHALRADTAQLPRVSRQPPLSRTKERCEPKPASSHSQPEAITIQARRAQPSGPPRPAQPASGGPPARGARSASTPGRITPYTGGASKARFDSDARQCERAAVRDDHSRRALDPNSRCRLLWRVWR